MATVNRSSIQLFHELKSKYPEVPDENINSCIQENGFDKERCMQALQRESPSYLFGARPVNDHVSRRLQELHIKHDNLPPSSPGTNQHLRLLSGNRDAGADIQANSVNIDSQGRQSPSVAPSDFSAYVSPNANNSPRQIPNINCTTYGGADSSGNASPQSTGSPSEGRRAIKVLHYPSRSPTTPPGSSMGLTGPQYVYRIQFGTESGGMCTVSPQSPSLQNLHQSLPTSVNTTGQYSPEAGAGPQSYTGSQVSNQYKHSSQATIYINQNTNNGQISPDRPSNRTNNYSPFSPPLDPRLGSHNLPIHQIVGHNPPSQSYLGGVQQIPHGYNQPLSVTIRASGPEGADRMRYIPNTADRGVSGYTVSGAHSPTRYGVSALPSDHLRSQYTSTVHPPFHMQQQATHKQTPLVNTSSAFITPTLPRLSSAAPSVSTHAIPVLGGQSSSEHGNIVLQETDTGRHKPSYPTLSPASSHSSLSSESSRSDMLQRQRSGSIQEEAAYTQALLQHQEARKNRLEHELSEEFRKLEKLRAEVSQMEKNMLERRSLRKNSFPGVEDVTKMREANRKLQTDIQVMVNEIDMYKNGQVPFSVMDPHGQQNFYKNIPTGQRVERNSIHANQPTNHAGSESPPPLPKREKLNVVPPAPPIQPPTGSGDSEEGEQWSCSACTFLNHPALNKCECCEMPRCIQGS